MKSLLLRIWCFVLAALIIVAVVFFANLFIKNKFSKLPNNDEWSIDVGQLVSIPVSKDAKSLFEVSYESDNKKVVWNFIKSNYKVKDQSPYNDQEYHKYGLNYEPLLVRDYDTGFLNNLSGFEISTDDIQNDNNRVDIGKKIKEHIMKMGYKKVNMGDKLNSFLLVDIGVNKGENYTHFIKGDQIFRVSYRENFCDDVPTRAYCYVKTEYFNNIKKQIWSQISVLDKLVDIPKLSTNTNIELSKENLVKNFYIEYPFEAKKINNYTFFTVGDSVNDGYDFLCVDNGNGFWKPILYWDFSKKILLDEFNQKLKNIPKNTLCNYYGYVFRNDLFVGSLIVSPSIVEKCN